MILAAAPASLAATPLYDLARWTHRLGQRSGREGEHHILGDGTMLHRIWLHGAPSGGALAALLPCDAMIETRLEAVARLDRWLRGSGLPVPAGGPTAYQARRLDMLLAILDLRLGSPVTSHEVARRIVYPRMDVGQGAAWKSSSERRRTQRLIREAEALMAGGYRVLLGGRQKMPGH